MCRGLACWPRLLAEPVLGPERLRENPMLRPLKFWLALLVLIVPAMTVEAVTTQQKVQATPADFGQGELEQVAVTQEGRLTLAPALTRLAEIPAPILWRMGADSKGNVYLASGNEGKIYLVRAGSNKVEVLADFPETQVLALAVRPDGMVYAATAPDGKIFRLSDGTPPAVFVAPGARYVWDLLLDGKGGLLAATGSPGRVLRIAESGAIETLLKSDEEHLLSLSTDGKQQLYVGSAEEGLVYRLDLSRKDPAPFVLFDAPGNEVKQVLALPDGSVFALTLGPAGSAEPDHPSRACWRRPLRQSRWTKSVSRPGCTSSSSVVLPSYTGNLRDFRDIAWRCEVNSSSWVWEKKASWPCSKARSSPASSPMPQESSSPPFSHCRMAVCWWPLPIREHSTDSRKEWLDKGVLPPRRSTVVFLRSGGGWRCGKRPVQPEM